MTRMTPAEIFELLSTGTRTAHVASTRADGSPHVAPVWFLADGTPDSFVIHFTTSASSVKGRTFGTTAASRSPWTTPTRPSRS